MRRPGRGIQQLPPHRLQWSGQSDLLPLQGPTSQILSLGPGEEKQLAWEPVDRQQCEIEIRARMIAVQATLGDVPVVRFAAEFGHGDAVWKVPQPALALISGTPFVGFGVPARGMVHRLNSREFRIAFTNAGLITGAALPGVTLQVTILPTVGGVQPPRWPLATFAGPAVGGVLQPFPMDATQWKVMGADGLPPVAAGSVVFTGIAGALIGPVAWATVDDWVEIPHDAVGWVPSAAIWAVYR